MDDYFENDVTGTTNITGNTTTRDMELNYDNELPVDGVIQHYDTWALRTGAEKMLNLLSNNELLL